MPYLPTPQAYLEQSALLLQAYPDAVRYSQRRPNPSVPSSTAHQAPKPPHSTPPLFLPHLPSRSSTLHPNTPHPPATQPHKPTHQLTSRPGAQKITTKYTFAHATRSSSSATNPQTTQPDPAPQPQTPQTPEKPRIATLTLKTFHPESGICLKYRTNKGAEVGRLISSLGKLAAGADVAGLGLGLPGSGGGSSGVGMGAADVEMGDAPPPASSGVAGAVEGGNEAASSAGAGAGAGGKSGKGKKKGGKGKR
ncbi:hypothetical protein BP00DRAFT_494505 [Aspergillus indologenus CBS 114.80]|uniref:SRP9 domain-containing protein n=1 Tax=Aspergillus indologenus CBS 114.80 TaxID=1450541 RepID=A0A2V5I6U7_9EURO|nr:hypothetical protein BP00DRAFT_494505 [Aspergillus indologenus CBS 114.80]